MLRPWWTLGWIYSTAEVDAGREVDVIRRGRRRSLNWKGENQSVQSVGRAGSKVFNNVQLAGTVEASNDGEQVARDLFGKASWVREAEGVGIVLMPYDLARRATLRVRARREGWPEGCFLGGGRAAAEWGRSI